MRKRMNDEMTRAADEAAAACPPAFDPAAFLKVAADGPGQLRRADVGRLFDECPAEHRGPLGSYLLEACPALADEVNERWAAKQAEEGYALEGPEPAPPKFVLLPPNLAVLADLAGTEKNRFALAGVRLTYDRKTRAYRACATDGKRLVVVEGEGDDPAQYPELPLLAAADGDATEATVPAGPWKEAFAKAKKVKYKPILQNVAVALGATEATLASTNLETQNICVPRLIDGKYPDVGLVLKHNGGEAKPKATVSVPPKSLAEILKALDALCEAGCERVDLEFYKDGDPLVLRAKNAGKGQKVTGLVVPLG